MKTFLGLGVGWVTEFLEVALALVGYVFLIALTYGFTQVFSGRGALILVDGVPYNTNRDSARGLIGPSA